jgi:hypothetical protein
MVLGPTKGGVMEYVYDYRSLMSDEHAVTVANQWGRTAGAGSTPEPGAAVAVAASS